MSQKLIRIAAAFGAVAAVVLFLERDRIFGHYAERMKRTLEVELEPSQPSVGKMEDEPVVWFEPEFTAEQLVRGLLSEATALPEQKHRRVDLTSFTTWFDGRPRFVYGWTDDDPVFGLPQRWHVVNGDLSNHDEQPVSKATFALQMLEIDGGRRLIASIDDEGPGVYPDTIVGLDAERRRLWSYRTPELNLEDFAILYDAKGPYGVAVANGGDTGTVALDGTGSELWRMPRRHVTYEVHSHPALPGTLLEVGGDLELYRHDRGSTRVHKIERQRGYWTDLALLFPDAEGKPAIAASGLIHDGDLPVISRLDEGGNASWRVRPKSRAEALALLEPEGRERLIAATTRGGHLILINDEGVLRARIEMPNDTPGMEVATYHLAAGELAPGRWAIAVRLLWGAYLYEVDVTKLDAR